MDTHRPAPPPPLRLLERRARAAPLSPAPQPLTWWQRWWPVLAPARR